MRICRSLLAAILLLAAAPASAAPSPYLHGIDLSDLPVPDAPFDESANADAAVARAFVEARAEHKLVLLDLGANWCGDCRVLAAIMELPEVRQFLASRFVTVKVDVGRFNRNLQIPAHWGIRERLRAIPTILVVEPDGTLVNTNNFYALGDAASMNPQDVVNWLAQWAR